MIKYSCLFLLLVGCSSPSYDIYIDNTFTQDQQVDIETALEDWHTKTGGMYQYSMHGFFDASKRSSDTTNQGTIHIYKQTPNFPSYSNEIQTAGDTVRYINSSNIQINPTLPTELFSRVITHELGHAAHLDHYHGNAYSIMRPQAGNTYNVECPDITAFCQEWGCKIKCEDIVDSETNPNVP